MSNNDLPDPHINLPDDDIDAEAVENNRAKANLSEAWKEKPVFRLMVIVIPVLVVLVVVIGLWNMTHSTIDPSQVSKAPPSAPAPGEQNLSPAYKEALQEDAAQRAEIARQTGQSAIPTPIADTQNKIQDADKPSDPLEKWRGREPEAPTPQPIPQPTPVPVQQPPAQPVQPAPPPDTNGMSQAMIAQIKSLTESWQPKPVTMVKVPEDKPPEKAAENGNNNGGNQQASNAPMDQQIESPAIVSAGTVLYGELLTEANSDIPAPILVQILSGPLKGARAIGSFQSTEDYIILGFQTVIMDDKEYKGEIVALDPATTSAGLVTDVDRHYFTRYILPAAASFISGVGKAVSDTNSTTTITGNSIVITKDKIKWKDQVKQGLGESASTVADALKKESDRPPTVKVEVGTPIGLMFVTSLRAKNQ